MSFECKWGLNSKINLKEIQRVVSANDIVGRTETLTNVFHAEEFNEHETFTGTDKSKLKCFRGPAFLIRKSLKYRFTERNLGLWLDVNFNCVDYSIGFYYIPCESSRHWDGNFFDEIQGDILKFKNPSRNILLKGDFNARTGNLDDCLLLDREINSIEPGAKRDTKINSNDRLLVDLCKTTEIAILNGRIGEDKKFRSISIQCSLLSSTRTWMQQTIPKNRISSKCNSNETRLE